MAMNIRLQQISKKHSVTINWNFKEGILYVLLLLVNCVLRIFCISKTYNKIIFLFMHNYFWHISCWTFTSTLLTVIFSDKEIYLYNMW